MTVSDSFHGTRLRANLQARSRLELPAEKGAPSGGTHGDAQGSLLGGPEGVHAKVPGVFMGTLCVHL